MAWGLQSGGSHVADLLKTGSDWLHAQQKAHASQTVTYYCGGQSVEVKATIGRTVFETDDGSGVIIESEVRDYLIEATDLVLGGETTLPQRGDRIRETQGSTVVVYEVMSPGGAPCYRFSDPYQKRLRIHTKQVDTE